MVAVPFDARQVANFILDRASEEGRPLTHLALQKILYFSHAWHLGKYNERLIGQRFEAWQYGPVIRVIFDQLKVYKDQPINSRLQIVDPELGQFQNAIYDFDPELSKFLSNIYSYYGRIDPRKLIDLTHETDGPWEKVWIRGSGTSVVGMYMSDDDIRMWILREGGRGEFKRH